MAMATHLLSSSRKMNVAFICSLHVLKSRIQIDNLGQILKYKIAFSFIYKFSE